MDGWLIRRTVGMDGKKDFWSKNQSIVRKPDSSFQEPWRYLELHEKYHEGGDHVLLITSASQSLSSKSPIDPCTSAEGKKQKNKELWSVVSFICACVTWHRGARIPNSQEAEYPVLWDF